MRSRRSLATELYAERRSDATDFVGKSELFAGLLELRCVEAQVCHATHVKEHALANIGKTKEYLLANGAPHHDAGTLHVHMRLGKALDRTALRTLSLCSCDIHGEYCAQCTCGSVTVKIVVDIGTHCRSPVGPKRSVLILSGLLPEAVRRPAALSTNDVGPQT